MAFFVTPGNIDDRKALLKMSKYMRGKLFGDNGYLSKLLQESLWEQEIEWFTKLHRRNMKPVALENFD